MSNTDQKRILVTGAAGKIGAIGPKLVELLLSRGFAVRAMVRSFDDRSEALSKLGAEVAKGDLTDLQDLLRVMDGCSRVYFGMSVSSSYLDATVAVAAVAKQLGVEVLVNISQMTVSQLSLTHMVGSPQHKLHWLAEQVLNWSGLPVVHVRPTVFMEHPFFNQWAAESIKKSKELRLPFGSARTSPIATADVTRVLAHILANPTPHIGKIYELTGPKSQDSNAIAQEYSTALGFSVKYVDVPIDEWEKELQNAEFPQHVKDHIKVMAHLHKDNEYDRYVDTVEKLTGAKPITIAQWVQDRVSKFK